MEDNLRSEGGNSTSGGMGVQGVTKSPPLNIEEAATEA